jgi:hypothetical protein
VEHKAVYDLAKKELKNRTEVKLSSGAKVRVCVCVWSFHWRVVSSSWPGCHNAPSGRPLAASSAAARWATQLYCADARQRVWSKSTERCWASSKVHNSPTNCRLASTTATRAAWSAWMQRKGL